MLSRLYVKSCLLSYPKGKLHFSSYNFLFGPLNLTLKFFLFQAKLVRSKYDGSHVTMVYSALSTLLLLGDNLSRVDRRGTLAGLSAMQCSDEPGLFKAGDICGERDMRFVFSAVASCYILNGLDSINCENVADFVAKCQVCNFPLAL